MSRALLNDVVMNYIDAKLSVDGHITTKDITNVFTLNRQSASRLFAQYKERYPGNMHHDTGARKYVKSEGFSLGCLGEKSPSEYLRSVVFVFV